MHCLINPNNLLDIIAQRILNSLLKEINHYNDIGLHRSMFKISIYCFNLYSSQNFNIIKKYSNNIN